MYKCLTIKNILLFWGGYFFLYILVSYAYIYSINVDVRAFFIRLRDLFGAMSYALLFLCIYEQVGKYLSWLEAYGKLGLTNYCLQDILGVVFMTTIFVKGEYSFTFMLFFFIGVYFLLLLFIFQVLRLPEFPTIKFVFQQNACSLCGKCGLREVSVVGLVIGLEAYISAFVQQPLHLEVTYKVFVCHGVVAVAQVAVYQQTIVKQTPRQHTFNLHAVPTLFAGGEVAREIPVAVVYNL